MCALSCVVISVCLLILHIITDLRWFFNKFYLLRRNAVKLIDKTVDFGFEAGDVGAVGIGEDSLDEGDDGGLRWATIRQIVRDHHPDGKDLNHGNITQTLQSCAALHGNKDINPIILNYDQTNLRLNVVDRSF